MAKSKSLRGVTVSIVVNGTKAKEYGPPMDEAQHEYPKKTVLRYVEAISGTNYSILTEVSPDYKLKSSLEFQVHIDGSMLPLPRIFERNENRNMWICTTDGKEEIDYKRRHWKKPFKFSPLNIVDVHDRDRIKRDSNVAKHIGEIRVTVVRLQVPVDVPYSSTWGMTGNNKLEIAEKAVKGQALSHGTEYGEAFQYSEQKRIVNAKPQRGSRDPAAVFIFRYRSREALEAEHIIPRVQSPDILHGLSEEEIRRIARDSLSGNKSEETIIKKEAGADTGTWRKFTNKDETLTIDITGDEPVETREPKAPKEIIDLSDANEMEPGAYVKTSANYQEGTFFANAYGTEPRAYSQTGENYQGTFFANTNRMEPGAYPQTGANYQENTFFDNLNGYRVPSEDFFGYFHQY